MLQENKNRDFPNCLQPPPNITTSHSSPSAKFEAELCSPESLSYIEAFLRPLVREEVERKVEACFKKQDSSRSQTIDDETRTRVKFKLCFVNNIPSTIFTNNQIQAENDEPLQVAICRITNNDNSDNIIAETSATQYPLSSALIEFVVMDAQFGSAQQPQEDDHYQGIHWTVDEFNKSVVTQTPSLLGNDRTTRLKNGVAFINNLTFLHNSSRTRTKMIRLGVRVIDHHILANYPRIGEAVSNPFRVKHQRGQGNKKHHPPKGEDEVWRLIGIGRDGERHRRLSSKGIETVHDFVRAHQTDPRSLRKWLGKKVSDKKWKEIVKHASEYVPLVPTFDPNFGEYCSNKNIINPTTDTDGHDKFQNNYNHIFEDYYFPFGHQASTSNTHNYDVENVNKCNQYFQGAWTFNPTDANGWS